MQVQQSSKVRPYKRSPALSNSIWFNGILVSRMAGPAENDGEFDFTIAQMKPGNEPPPHVHSREDEFIYVLSGEMKFFVGSEVFSVEAGECIFLPRREPHAWLISSEEAHFMVLMTPGGFDDALFKLGVPAKRMDVPAQADSSFDPKELMGVLARFGSQMLTADEIQAAMPAYPR